MKSCVAVFVLGVCAWTAAAQAPASKKSAPAPKAAPAAKKSALDKTVLEAYVRHLFVWGPQIKVAVSDPKPSQELAGFQEVTVHASAGPATQNETFLISNDGQKIVRPRGRYPDFDPNILDAAKNPFQDDLAKLKTEFQPSMGTPGAPVVIVLFTDFQCPYCKEESKMLRQNLLSAFPKQVRLYFKDYPLVQMHPWAKPASMAGRCVFRQNPGAFWDFHDWAFENQAQLNEANLKDKTLEFAKTKELDVLQLSRCMETRATEAEVDKNIADGKALMVASTPTLFVNGRRLVGQVSWPSLRQIIEFEIEYQRTAKNAGEDCACEVALPSPLNSR